MDYFSKFEELKSENLSLDLTRGKPSSDQLDLSNSLMETSENLAMFESLDLRNYGEIKGIDSCRDLGAKILICDTKYAVMGSFNWLSNSGGSENEERSYIVYNKSFIEEELVEIMKNLYDPKKPLSRSKLMKNFVPFSRY